MGVMFSKEFNARAQICMQMLTGSIGRNSFGEIVIRLQPYKNYRENTEKLWKWPGNTCRKRVLAQMRKLCDTISSIWGNKIIKIDWIDHAATKTTKSSVCHILISHLWLIFFLVKIKQNQQFPCKFHTILTFTHRRFWFSVMDVLQFQ